MTAHDLIRGRGHCPACIEPANQLLERRMGGTPHLYPALVTNPGPWHYFDGTLGRNVTLCGLPIPPPGQARPPA